MIDVTEERKNTTLNDKNAHQFSRNKNILKVVLNDKKHGQKYKMINTVTNIKITEHQKTKIHNLVIQKIIHF